MKKKPTVAKLKKKLDAVFSKYIRLRYAHSKDGKIYCECVTCGNINEVSKMQCGHFMSRRYNSTRFNEQNCNVQCVACNRFDQGRQYEHHLYIEKEHGEGTSDKLYKLSRVNKAFKVEELQNAIEHYENKVNLRLLNIG
jgi:hypothetical protein